VMLRGSTWGAIEGMRDELWGEGLFQIGILYPSCFIANAFEIESEASWHSQCDICCKGIMCILFQGFKDQHELRPLLGRSKRVT
jgi:hypothetical protein